MSGREGRRNTGEDSLERKQVTYEKEELREELK